MNLIWQPTFTKKNKNRVKHWCVCTWVWLVQYVYVVGVWAFWWFLVG